MQRATYCFLLMIMVLVATHHVKAAETHSIQDSSRSTHRGKKNICYSVCIFSFLDQLRKAVNDLQDEEKGAEKNSALFLLRRALPDENDAPHIKLEYAVNSDDTFFNTTEREDIINERDGKRSEEEPSDLSEESKNKWNRFAQFLLNPRLYVIFAQRLYKGLLGKESILDAAELWLSSASVAILWYLSRSTSEKRDAYL